MTQKLLHDDILEALPEDFVRRMRNWVRGRDGSSVTTSGDVYSWVRTDRYLEPGLPTLMGEAKDTDLAVRKLPERYQEAVATFWNYERQTIEWMLQATPRLRLWRPTKRWFLDWLDRGHQMLQSELARAAKEATERREETEVTQRSAAR